MKILYNEHGEIINKDELGEMIELDSYKGYSGMMFKPSTYPVNDSLYNIVTEHSRDGTTTLWIVKKSLEDQIAFCEMKIHNAITELNAYKNQLNDLLTEKINER